jgi:hypothetical protein
MGNFPNATVHLWTKVQDVTLQLRSVRGGISLADLVCLGSCCLPFGNQTWLGTSSFISDVPLISGGKLFFSAIKKRIHLPPFRIWDGLGR